MYSRVNPSEVIVRLGSHRVSYGLGYKTHDIVEITMAEKGDCEWVRAWDPTSPAQRSSNREESFSRLNIEQASMAFTKWPL